MSLSKSPAGYDQNQITGVILQDINIPIWIWEVMNVYFTITLPITRIQYDFIWIIPNLITNTTYFLPVTALDSVNDYAKLYPRELGKFHSVPLTITRVT